MVRPFSERVASVDWRREVESWVEDQVATSGAVVNGPIEQPRIRPWSTQLIVPTTAGSLWFKANCPSLSFEPRLHAELARLEPGSFDEPWAIDAARGWMLTIDRGTTLGDSHLPTADDWRGVLAGAARLQRRLADHRDELRAAGIPDCSPSTVADRLDRFVETFAGLPDQHPAHVSPELEVRLRAARPAVAEAAQLLAESRLPTTWQHGDLHPRNVFATDAGLRVFDFGDSQWAHAVEVLSVPYGLVNQRPDLTWDEVVGAYRDEWGITTAELDDLTRAAALTQPVNRCRLWWSCLDEATAAEWAEWGHGPLQHLTRVLEP